MTADNTPPQFAWKYTSANEPMPPLSASRAFMRLNKSTTNAHEEVTIRSIDDLMTLEDGLPTETKEPDELDDLTLPNVEIPPPFGFTHSTNDVNHDEASNNTDQCIIELTQDEELELFNNNKVQAIYTDGSYKEGLAGVGLYAQLRTGPHISMHTFGGTQSIFRAELFGILKAIELALLHPNTKHVIFTDSLACIFALWRWMRQPNSLRNHDERPLLKQIIDLAHSHPSHIHICHVKSHTGIPGNESADILARLSTIINLTTDEPAIQALLNITLKQLQELDHRINITPPLTHIPHSEDALPIGGWSLYAPHYTTHNITKEQQLARLCERDHYLDSINGDDSSAKAVRRLLMEIGRQNLGTINEFPDIIGRTNIWEEAPEKELVTWLRHTHNRVYTSNSPGHPLYDPKCQNPCPVCATQPNCDNPGPDTAEHIRGGCTYHNLMRNTYTIRHDDKVLLTANALLNGPEGLQHIRAQIGATCSLEHNTHEGKIIDPKLWKGQIPPTRLTPDLVKTKYADTKTIQTTPPTTNDEADIDITMLDKTEPLDLNEEHVYDINIYDFTVVANEANLADRTNKKIEKYTPLVEELQNLGHNATFHPLILGSRVPIVPNEYHKLALLTGLDQTSPEFRTLVNKIWKHTLHDLQRTQSMHNLLRIQSIQSNTGKPQIPQKSKSKCTSSTTTLMTTNPNNTKRKCTTTTRRNKKIRGNTKP